MIILSHVRKSYGKADMAVEVLKDINLKINTGEFVTIMGPSGSGKSTLLNILGALDTVSSGEYIFLDTDINKLSKDQLALFRRYMLGFVFQGFNLLKRSSAIENVEMPLLYLGVGAKQRKQRAIEALKSVGLGDRVYYNLNKLSGGQQQRVAIARAIVTKPRMLIVDEPTGNLDMKRGHEIMQLLKNFNKDGITIILVTHEEDIAKYGSRIIHLLDGVIQKDSFNAV